MKQKITYVAFDGMEFATAAECVAYEEKQKPHRIKVRGSMVFHKPVEMERGTLAEYQEFVENAIGMYFEDSNQFYRLDTLVGFPHDNTNISDYSGYWAWDVEHEQFVKLDMLKQRLENELYRASEAVDFVTEIEEELKGQA